MRCGRSNRPAHCNASIGRWNRVDAFVRIVLYCCRTVSNNCRVLVQIPSLDLAAFEGVASLLLAAVFWTNSPRLGPWVFGFSVGTSMILRGWSSIMFAQGVAHLRKLPQSHRRNDKHEKRPVERSGFARSW